MRISSKLINNRILIYVYVGIILINIFNFVVFSFNNYSEYFLFFSITFFIVLISVKPNKKWSIILSEWTKQNNINFELQNIKRFEERLSKNPNKYYFGMRNTNWWDAKRDIFVSGSINNKQIWFYKFTGISLYRSLLREIRNTFIDSERSIKGWCLEVSTHRHDAQLLIYKTHLRNIDNLNIESNEFEKKYHIDVRGGHGTLQLLDPNILHQIINSNLTALEFSDSSLVVYTTKLKPSVNDLNNMLHNALKIAEQVDRNFPLGKYEKK